MGKWGHFHRKSRSNYKPIKQKPLVGMDAIERARSEFPSRKISNISMSGQECQKMSRKISTVSQSGGVRQRKSSVYFPTENPFVVAKATASQQGRYFHRDISRCKIILAHVFTAIDSLIGVSRLRWRRWWFRSWFFSGGGGVEDCRGGLRRSVEVWFKSNVTC